MVTTGTEAKTCGIRIRDPTSKLRKQVIIKPANSTALHRNFTMKAVINIVALLSGLANNYSYAHAYELRGGTVVRWISNV
jgi:hypothetical protein